MPGIENCPGTLPRLLRHGKWSPAGVQRAVLTPKPAGNERLWNIGKVGTKGPAVPPIPDFLCLGENRPLAAKHMGRRGRMGNNSWPQPDETVIPGNRRIIHSALGKARSPQVSPR
jgi:hypothetical protein